MKLIISHKGIKRELETPFALCMNMHDLDVLILEMKAARTSMEDSSYGWVRIDPSHPSDSPINTRPLGWTEAGNVNPPIER